MKNMKESILFYIIFIILLINIIIFINLCFFTDPVEEYTYETYKQQMIENKITDYYKGEE